MLGELLVGATEAGIKESIERIVGAEQLAELGVLKTKEYGSLVRSLHPSLHPSEAKIGGLEQLKLTRTALTPSDRIHLAKNTLSNKNMWLTLRPQDVAKNVAEYLCDFGIVPEKWAIADSKERLNMLDKATQIMGKQLMLPKEWISTIQPMIKEIPPKANGTITRAYASYRAMYLPNGGVKLTEVPKLVVNASTLEGDFYKAMSTLYHEMIHIKQFASVDGLAPTSHVDFRLLDLIEAMHKQTENRESRVEYLYSPFEAEAWQWAPYFEEMLRAVIRENTLITA